MTKKTALFLSLLSLSNLSAQTNETPYDRTLPFLAQSAIDKGFDLPEPYGVSLVYNYTEQDFIIDELSVFTKDGTAIDIDKIVALENAKPASHSLQLKVDAYLLPFLNVFAMVGGITGEAPLDVIIKRKRPNKSDLNVPVEAAVTGYSFTAGMMFATMIDRYFISVPLTYTYSMLDRSYESRKVVNVSPRVGNVISLKNQGKLAVFIGANYMDVDLKAKGVVYSDSGEELIYEAHQKNVDKWNMSLGYNWMFNRAYSWNLEIGFLGSRKNVTTGLNYRF